MSKIVRTPSGERIPLTDFMNSLIEQASEAEERKLILPKRKRTLERYQRIAADWHAWKGDRKSFCEAHNISDSTLTRATKAVDKKKYT